MKVLARANRELVLINARNSQNENIVETIELEVPERFQDYNKKIVFVTDDGVLWDLFENDEYKLQKAITKYEKVDFYIWLTKGDEDWRSQTKQLIFYQNKDASGEITPEEIGGVNTVINLLEDEISKVERLDITAEKVGKVTTLTITDKDGTQTSYEILDGEDGQDGDDYVITPEDYQAIANIVLQTISVPTKTSDLTNDSGFIDNTVNNLTNYYNKNQTYNKDEIDGKLASIYRYKGTVATYNDLPSSGQTIGDVYNVESDGSNYAWNGTIWDKLGGEVDLSGYYNKSQTDTLLNGKVDNSTLNDYYTKTRADELLNTKVDKTTYNTKMEQVDTSLNNKLEQSDLVDYVKNTDYATSSTGGVIKSASGLYTFSNGTVGCDTLSYASYQNFVTNGFISKGTLENVITGKELINNTTLQASQSAQDTLIAELQQENQDLYDAMAKTTGTGTDITLNNTAKGKMPIAVSGNTEQTTYTGKNLLNITLASTSKNGVTFTNNGDGSITLNGTASANTAFVMSNQRFDTQGIAYSFGVGRDMSSYGNTLEVGGYIYEQDGTFKYNLSTRDGRSPRTLSNGEYLTSFFVYIASGTNISNLKLFPQLEVGSTVTSFEPYVGGTASPNPDYPQDVRVVTGENTVKVVNKNLYNKDTDDVGHVYSDSGVYGTALVWTTSDWIPVKSTSQYVLSQKTTGTSNLFFSEFDSNKTFIKRTTTSPLTPTNATKYVRISFKNDIGTYDIQLEENSTATTYEPHQEQSLPLSLQSKNLFDKNTVIIKRYVSKNNGTVSTSDDWSVSDFIPIKNNTQYNYSGIINSFSSVAGTCFYNKNKEFISSIASNIYNFTTPQNAYYVRISFNTETPNDIQLEEGSTPTSYQPYYHYELCKKGDYQDYPWKDESTGKWYVKKNIYNTILNGTQGDWDKGSLSNQNYSVFQAAGFLTGILKGSTTLLFSNKFTPNNNITISTLEYESIYTGVEPNAPIRISVKNSRLSATTSNGFNAWLVQNNVILYGVRQTPTDIEITDTTLINQLEAIYNTAKSYKGQTHIFTVTEDGNVAPILDATSLLDLNSIVS